VQRPKDSIAEQRKSCVSRVDSSVHQRSTQGRVCQLSAIELKEGRVSRKGSELLLARAQQSLISCLLLP
jgi:hypothetical protein